MIELERNVNLIPTSSINTIKGLTRSIFSVNPWSYNTKRSVIYTKFSNILNFTNILKFSNILNLVIYTKFSIKLKV